MISERRNIEFCCFFMEGIGQRLDAKSLDCGMFYRSLSIWGSIHIPYRNGVYKSP